MPYGTKKRGKKYITYNTETGKVMGTHSTLAKAKSQKRLLYAVKHGWKPTRKK